MTWRTELVELLPWVERLDVQRRCDSYRRMSATARRDPVTRESYRCHAVALWRFTALPNGWGRSGTYCWSHLMFNGVRSGVGEENRFTDWCDHNLERVNEIRARHGLRLWSEVDQRVRDDEVTSRPRRV